MSNRVYNIMFHTHTISGIIISAALYVIFFTGSISFLREEIIAWERNEPVSTNYFSEVDFDSLLHNIHSQHEIDGKDIAFYQTAEGQMASTSISNSDKTKIEGKSRRGEFFLTNLSTFQTQTYQDAYTLGEFFYRLHFFAQLNFFGRSGYFLSGLVAFFFLFAVITGVIVHWKKIVSSFYVFRPKAKLKTIWTDAHVALGIIGLPYQFMFAVTGAYLIVGYMVMLPPVKALLFNDDEVAFEKVIRIDEAAVYKYSGEKLSNQVSFNSLVKQTKNEWPEFKINSLLIYNYGDSNMHIKVEGHSNYKDKLLGKGFVVYKALDGSLVDKMNPNQSTSYVQGATDILKRLHFGDFGGYGLKLIYFVLGIITCFVILSGVLIWLVARDKKNVAERKRKFNGWLVNIYMAICLSIYPMTALIFIIVKCFSSEYTGSNKELIYQVFFWGWLALSCFFTIMKDNYFTNKVCLILGGVLGFLVPISNGFISGNWPWVTWQNGHLQIFVVDVFWILLSLTAISVVFKLKVTKGEN